MTERQLSHSSPTGGLDHSSLPSVSKARLPQTYESAKTALSECQRLDECKDWSDKAAAMASYAKQAADDQLERLAMKIRARAIKRCGELLREIEPAPNHHGNSTKEGTHPSRTAAAKEAGLSQHQQKTALRVASLPDEKFDQMVDKDKPATITELAEAGTKKKPTENIVNLHGRTPQQYNKALHFCALVSEYEKELDEFHVAGSYPPLTADQRDNLENDFRNIEYIHGRLLAVLDGLVLDDAS